MNNDDKVLFKGKFTEIISPSWAPDYEFLSEGEIVIVIPILENGKIGVRKEWCPPYLIKDKTGEDRYYTVLSGHIEDGEVDDKAAIRELREEAGIVIQDGDLIKLLDNIPICKSTSLRATIFVADIRQHRQEEPQGDGSEGERRSETVWLEPEEIPKIILKENVDLLFAVLHLITMMYLQYKQKSV